MRCFPTENLLYRRLRLSSADVPARKGCEALTVWRLALKDRIAWTTIIRMALVRKSRGVVDNARSFNARLQLRFIAVIVVG